MFQPAIGAPGPVTVPANHGLIPAVEPDGVEVLAPTQVERIAALLPGIREEARAITDLVVKWERIPTGLGADGPLHQFVEEVPIAKIWIDHDLYVHSSADEAQLTEEELRQLLASFQQRQVKNEVGTTEQHAWQPLLLVKRSNPTNHTQNLLLLRDLRTYTAAKRLKWPKVEAIVYPELPDYDVRNVGLHLAMNASPPSLLEVMRHIFLQDMDWRRGRRAPDSPRPPMTQEDLARALGCSRSYISKLARLWRDQDLRALVGQNIVPIRVAIRATEALGRYPEEMKAVIAHIVAHRLVTQDAESYIAARRDTLRQMNRDHDQSVLTGWVAIIRRAASMGDQQAGPLIALVGEQAHEQAVQYLTNALAILIGEGATADSVDGGE